jgi:hypothetical protein
MVAMIPTAMILNAATMLRGSKSRRAGAHVHGNRQRRQDHKLADYRGKYVVLEWHNNGCPYVGKQYDSGNMQKLQKRWTNKGVVWFTVLSSAPGKQDSSPRATRTRT